MAGINVDADIKAKGFISGIGDMVDALEDLQKEVEDVQKDGDSSLEKLEKSFAEAAKASRDAGDDIKKSLGGGTKAAVLEADDGLKDFKQEANSTAKESAASFDGSAESIVGSFQEIAANAFEGFGPAGAIAGLAVAAGIGIATSEFQKSEEAAKAAKERISELGTAFIESGADVAQVEAFKEALQGIVTNADDAAVKIDDLRKFTKKYGDAVPSVSDFAIAYSGNADAIEKVTDELEKAIEAEKEKNYTTKTGAEQSTKRQDAYQAEIDKLEAIQEETAAAKQIEEDWLASGGAEIQAKADAIDQINASYDDAVYSVDNFKNAETGIYDLDAYAASIEERARLLEEYQNNLAKSGLTTEQKAALNEMGVEQANAILKGLKDPNTSQATKDTITKGLKTASQEGSGVAKKEIEDAFKKPVDARINVKADTSTAQSDLDNLIRARTAVIKVDFQDRNGKRVY